MNATLLINDFKTTACPRCSGKGRLACFSHNKGGVCFSCNGSGNYAIPFSRPMNDDEVLAKLAEIGLPLMPQGANIETDELFDENGWLPGVIPSTEEHAALMTGARIALSLALAA